MNKQLEDFFIQRVVLDEIHLENQSISLKYLLDDETVERTITYNSISFAEAPLNNKQTLKCFAVSMGVVYFLRFGAVLPASFDVKKYSSWIQPQLLTFLQNALPHWSEHRYQLKRMDYAGTNIIVNHNKFGTLAQQPIWRLDSDQSKKVIVASGSGKDSLLCAKLIESAGLDYDLITYMDTLYGEPTAQDQVFANLSAKLQYQNQHIITISDGYYPWLESRLEQYQVREILQAEGMIKPFRVEAGETFACPLLFAPVQVVHNLPLVILGHEKSADAHNLIDQETGQKVAHQWPKSIYGERVSQALQNALFENIHSLSITKPLYDVKIFKTLFEMENKLPYLTNSCNIKKPWCCQCEKCAYVFAGFAAFGDHAQTVAAFGEDLFQKESLLFIWSELLGLKGYIPWECVGQAEEVQLYFYKAYQAGVKGVAIDLFRQEVLNPLPQQNVDIETHFAALEVMYSQIDQQNHHIPAWLWQKLPF